jgi:2'-5' RNA ligase
MRRDNTVGNHPQALRFRAFISVEIEPSDALRGLLDDLKGSGADLKVVRPDLMHVTLKFLGDTEESLVADISERIGRAVDPVRQFDIGLKGMGAFPSMSSIRVVWVGIEDDGRLLEIARGIEQSMVNLGFERESRGFKAHLTVARTRSAGGLSALQNLVRENAVRDFGRYRVNRLLLMKSVLSPSGPTYSVVTERRLAE